MLNIISIVAGLVAAALAFVGLIPFFGWVNWLMLPIAFIGVILGQLSSSNFGRNLNLVVLAVGALRLFIGGGLF